MSRENKIHILEVLVTVMEGQVDELFERIKSIEIQLKKEKTHG
jgi:uncharacterized protein YqgV (UPF0045/DUF77 family)